MKDNSLDCRFKQHDKDACITHINTTKKSLQNRKIAPKDTLDLDEYYNRHNKDMSTITSISLMCFGILLGMIILAGLKACDKDSEPVAVRTDCYICHNYKR